MAQMRYHARLGKTAEDLQAVQRLRFRAFRADDAEQGRDADRFDAICSHMLIEEATTGHLVATYRLLPLGSGAEIDRSYSAQFYELKGLADYEGQMVEMGRFCVAPGETDPAILRSAWAALTAYVDREGVAMLFGCSSFQGTDAQSYADAFAMLRDRHLAPRRRSAVRRPHARRARLQGTPQGAREHQRSRLP